MKKIIYKAKNNLFKLSQESRKLKRPSFDELIKFRNFKKTKFNKFAISFAGGRSGQNWFSKIFNSHSNWIGSCERFADYEAFYRYVTYYKLPINKDEFYNLIKLNSKRDMSMYQNCLISSPYLSFGIEDIVTKLKPDYIFFNIRNPINTIESLYKKGWYKNFENKKIISPSIDITEDQYRSFSRIIPKKDFLDKWLSLTRIGKITWFWTTINKKIYNSFNKIKNIDKYYVKLEDADQNYEFYERLSKKFNFKNLMTKKKFLNVVNKAENKGDYDKYIYLYKEWSKLEKKEFENIISTQFHYYNKIKTNI